MFVSARDRLQGVEAASDLADVVAHALGVPVLDGGEDPDPAVLHGEDLRAVGPPHDVRGIGANLAIMCLPLALPDPEGREQVGSAHQPQDSLSRDLGALHEAQPRPDLSVALPLER
ncbi:hypothetical protein D3C87_1394810 [compost metagenome]